MDSVRQLLGSGTRCDFKEHSSVIATFVTPLRCDLSICYETRPKACNTMYKLGLAVRLRIALDSTCYVDHLVY